MPNAVSSAGESSSVHYIRSETQNSGIKLDSEMFLKLLVAQVQYQDPLEPQSNTEFLSQLAQMNEMEQLTQMNSSLVNSQAYNLIGKYAFAEVFDRITGISNQYFGLINSILLNSGTAYAVMDDKAIAVSNITRIFDSSYVENAAQTAEETKETEGTETTEEIETAETPEDSTADTDSEAAGNTTIPPESDSSEI